MIWKNILCYWPESVALAEVAHLSSHVMCGKSINSRHLIQKRQKHVEDKLIWSAYEDGTSLWKILVTENKKSVLLALLAKEFWPGHTHACGQRPDELTLMCYVPFAFKKERWKNGKLKEEKKTSNCKTSFQIFFLSNSFLNNCTSLNFLLLSASLLPLTPFLVSVLQQTHFFLCHGKLLPFFILFLRLS